MKSVKSKKIRLDDLLVKRGLCLNLDEARRLILANEVRIETDYVCSVGKFVDWNSQVYLRKKCKYVSRGGYKLKSAIDAFKIDISNKNCIDVGSSTGGFSDVLLQSGAKHVTCVDVNYGQLAWKIRNDVRVSVFERCNIKTASAKDLGAPFDVIVADVSFISLASLMGVFNKLGLGGSIFVGLIKPQFESKHYETDSGLVKDNSVIKRTIDEVKYALEQSNFKYKGLIKSPILGKKSKNTEFLICGVLKNFS